MTQTTRESGHLIIKIPVKFTLTLALSRKMRHGRMLNGVHPAPGQVPSAALRCTPTPHAASHAASHLRIGMSVVAHQPVPHSHPRTTVYMRMHSASLAHLTWQDEQHGRTVKMECREEP